MGRDFGASGGAGELEREAISSMHEGAPRGRADRGVPGLSERMDDGLVCQKKEPRSSEAQAPEIADQGAPQEERFQAEFRHPLPEGNPGGMLPRGPPVVPSPRVKSAVPAAPIEGPAPGVGS